MISAQALKEFKELYKKEYGDDISDEKATELAINLLTMMNVVYKPIKKEWVGKENPVDKAFDILFEKVAMAQKKKK